MEFVVPPFRSVPFPLASAALAAALLASGATACAQASMWSIPRGSASMPAVNDRPNPYRTVEGWAKLEGRTWGSTSAVDIDKDGRSIWVAERCAANNCLASTLDPILKFDASGKLVKSFGAGVIQSPHGIHVDGDGNIWVTDCSCTLGRQDTSAAAVAARAATPKGHQIHKFSPDGTRLLTLGKAGGGKNAEYFFQPNDVLVAPNGDIFVAEGHSSADTANARVLRFDRTGKLIKTWGKRGTGPTDMDQPHALALDSRGRLFVADRGNDRLQIYTQDGVLTDTWYQFSRISGLWIDRNDTLYAADSESGSVAPPHAAWKRGIRIGSARTGVVTAFIPDPVEKPRSTSSAEGVAVDAAGNIYGAEVGAMALRRYERKP
jgi:sugar lactone lactonase YvrE